MWRSCSPSGACTPITSRCGDGSSVTPRKWSGAYAGTSSRLTTRGGWTRRTSGLRASGATCIVRWILPAPPSTSSSRPGRTRPQQSAFWPKRWDGRTIPCRESSTRQACRLPAGDCATQRRGCSGGELPTPTGAVPNNVLEQDHRAIKRRINASQHFRSFWGAWRTIAGYEAIHMIRKGQACWSAMGTGSGLFYRFVFGQP